MFKLVLVVVLLGLAAADHINKNAETRNLVNDVSPDGQYRYGFDTTNGIAVAATGNAGGAQGSFSWVSPEGEHVQLSYVADQNGYQATGSHIPTPPPVPDHVLRALEWIRSHPVRDDYVRRY